MSTNTAFLRIPAIGLLIATLAACGELPSAVVLDPTPREPPSFPPAPGAVAIYERIGEHSWLAGYRSRYVFYDNGAFGLQYLRAGGSSMFEYAGTRSQADSVITFSFHGDGRWFATGTMRGDTLIVQYNIDMMLSDFEDGAYLLSDETPVSPVAIYERSGEHSYPVGLRSRYVFYDNEAFGLQYLRAGSGWSRLYEYAGTRSQADSVITFSFHGDSRWFATGTMRGDTLIVQYNTVMMLSDFEDGVYLLSPEDD